MEEYCALQPPETRPSLPADGGPERQGATACAPAQQAALGAKKVQAVLEFIESSLHARLSVGEMAAVAGLSRFHFSRAFTRAVGRPPHAYLT
jgi:transcriptional regulator GlxA family with amidase domain